MANDYYTNLPPVEKAAPSIDPGLFSGALTAALDAASKQTGVSIQMSNRADSELRAAQERAKREAEARAEQQQRDLENAANIRAQTAYQEETTKYLTRVQEDAKKSGNLVSPEQIEYDIKQIGSKYTKVFKSQTGKASFEDMVSKTALNSSGQAAAMNDRVVKEQALTSLAYIQDDAAKKMIQSPDRANEILLESQQRLSQLPLSKELKFEADLKLQQGFGDFYLNNLAATDPDRFIEEFRAYDKPATPEGLKTALGTAQNIYKERQKEIVDFSTVTTISANNSLKEHRAMGDTFLKQITGGVPVQMIISDPNALNTVMSDYVDAGGRVLPQSIHDTLVNLSNTPDAQSMAIASQTFQTLKANPLTSKLLSSLPDEVAINLDLYNRTDGSSLEDKLVNFQNQKEGNKRLKDASPEIQKLDSNESLANIFGDELGFNSWVRVGEKDERFYQAAADVRRLRSEALAAGHYSEGEVTSFVVNRLRGMYDEVRLNGQLTLIPSNGLVPKDADAYIAPVLKKLEGLNLNVLPKGATRELPMSGSVKALQEGNISSNKAYLESIGVDTSKLQDTTADNSSVVNWNREDVVIDYVNTPIGDAAGYFTIRVGNTMLRELDEEGNSIGPVMIKNYKDQGEAALVKLSERAPELSALKAKEEATTKAIAAMDGSRITGEVAPTISKEEQAKEKKRVEGLTGGFQKKNSKIDIQVK